jgi:hypothetical protein
MKKKQQPPQIQEPVIAPEILELAKRSSALTDKLRPASKCTVCASDCSTTSNDQLCWVCRRLKISAWRDSDIQMNVQE